MSQTTDGVILSLTDKIQALCYPAKVRFVKQEGENVYFDFQCLESKRFVNSTKINIGVIESLFNELKGKSFNELTEQELDEVGFWRNSFSCHHTHNKNLDNE